MEPDSIGKRIKYLRMKRNLTIRQLADRSKVPSSTLSLVERGGRDGANLTVETIRKLAQALETTTDYLCGMYEGEPDSWPTGMGCRQASSMPADVVSHEETPASL